MDRPVVAAGIALSLALGGLAGAAEPPPDPLTPEAAVSLALAHHPMLAAAGASADGARADRSLARSGLLPRVGIVEQLNRSTNPVFVFASKLGQERFGPDDFAIEALNRPSPLTNAATRIEVEQNVWDAGRTRLSIGAAGAGVEAADLERQRAGQQIAFEAREAFWNVVLAEQMLAVALESEAAAEENLRLAGERVEAGVALRSDRMSAEVRRSEVRAMRVRAEHGVPVARVALARALGVEGPVAARLAFDEPQDAPAADDAGARVAEALEQRPDLSALDRRLRQSELGLRLARSGRLPLIGAGASYERNDEDPFGGAGDNWSVGLALRLSLFDGGETRARADRARADRARLEQLRRAMRDGIRLQVRAAWADRAVAAERLRLASAALDEAAEALRIVRERYAEGLAVMVELLGAEAALSGARARRVEALRDLAVSIAALDLAVGRLPQGS